MYRRRYFIAHESREQVPFRRSSTRHDGYSSSWTNLVSFSDYQAIPTGIMFNTMVSGILCRKGPFTKAEAEQCRVAIERYQEVRGSTTLLVVLAITHCIVI